MKYMIRCHFQTDGDYTLNTERLEDDIQFIKSVYKDTLESMVMERGDEDFVFEFTTINPVVARDILYALSTCFIVSYSHCFLVGCLFELAYDAAEMIFDNDRDYYIKTLGGNYEGTFIQVVKKEDVTFGYQCKS